MAGKHQRIYWDTCIFYALLKEEKHRAGEPEVIAEQARKFDAGTIQIVTSVITRAEVLQGKLSGPDAQRFTRMMQRSNFLLVDVNHAVADLAAKMRSDYETYTADGKKMLLSTPDAIHIASAAAYHISDFFTLDRRDKRRKNELAMTSVAPQVRKDYGVHIATPHGQMGLKYGSE